MVEPAVAGLFDRMDLIMQDPLGGSNHESPRVDPAQRINPGTMDY
jgi:hypothetical protein